MAVLIDTSILVAAERNGLPPDRDLDPEEATISVITASELLHGAHRAPDERVRNRRAAFVEGLLSAVDPLPATAAVARSHARLWADLERRGAMIGSHDLWIAASAVTHGMGVATVNVAEFERVPGLVVLAP
jgi:predicted nucleic acid-binding protein